MSPLGPRATPSGTSAPVITRSRYTVGGDVMP
jgi:hypothetical protein